MNGPEHYAEAERLIAAARTDVAITDPGAASLLLADAQVHATLALAAATAEPRATYVDPNLNYRETFIKGNAWVEVQS